MILLLNLKLTSAIEYLFTELISFSLAVTLLCLLPKPDNANRLRDKQSLRPLNGQVGSPRVLYYRLGFLRCLLRSEALDCDGAECRLRVNNFAFRTAIVIK